MAIMQFRVSQEEFTRIVESLQRKCVIGEIMGELQGIKKFESDEDKFEEIIDFIQEFMIDMDTEDVLGFYNYELVVDGETIQLDAEESNGRLKELVKAVMIPWKSIKA